jgi:phosphoglucosamine mutase
MARKLFGTDGIRGVAGEYPLDPRTVHATGVALGLWAERNGRSDAEIVIGIDTRESGTWIASQIAGGLQRRGIRTHFAGIVTTPGIAYLTRTGPFIAGVMVSASHNPYLDNGIKVFDHSGYKLPDDQEKLIEDDIFALRESGLEPLEKRLAAEAVLDQEYLNYLLSTLDGGLEGLKITVDCGNGAASQLGPELFRRLGAEVVPVFCSPDGRNINQNCGALHVENLREMALAHGSDAGVAFDGDADRALFVSASGKIIDGDSVLLMAAADLHCQGRLTGGTVVATVMSNLGLERALAELGIRLVRASVGDKYVLEEMLRTGAVLGGEQSGHIIFCEYATTGDGLLTALRVFDLMRRSGRNLDQLSSALVVYPQRLVNVRVREKRPLAELHAVGEQIRAAEDEFGSSGRILVRFSGTEPLARVMVEGPDELRVDAFAHRIAYAIQSELGV